MTTDDADPLGTRAARWRQVGAAARLELLDGIRGRRQLVVRAITPILLFGVVLAVSIVTRGADPVRRDPYRVAVEGDVAGARATLDALRTPRLVFEPTPDAALAAANGADIGVRLPDRLDEALAQHRPTSIEVFQTTVTGSSRAAVANLRAGLADLYKRQLDDQARAAAVAEVATIFTIDRTDVQLTTQGTRELSAQIVPALLTLQAAMLVNATATRILGRRNRGLLMAQLLLPLRRRDLAVAKALAELGIGALAASPVVLVVLAYVLATGSSRGGAGAAAVGVIATAIAAAALALPMVAVGLLIGTAAKSQEQVTLGTALSLVATTMVAAITALGDVPRPRILAVMPIQGMVSALRDVLSGSGSPLWFAVAVLSSTAFAAVLVRLAGRVYRTDRIVLRIA